MKNILALCAVIIMAVSCEQKPSLQKYFVEKSEKQGFIAMDIAPSFINTDKVELTPDEKEALKSLHKLNVLVFTANDSNRTQYTAEKDKVKGLLKEEQYDELMRFGTGSEGGSIHMMGEGENIEEFVVFAHQDKGFGVVRVLGEDMNPNNVLTLVGLLQKADLDMEQLKPLQDLMKK